MAMTGLLDKIAPEFVGDNVPRFVAGARYYADMDYLLYMQEPCSYRADRVDEFLTVLWHPDDDRLVGVKLKGWLFIFNELREKMGWDDEDFFPLVKALEFGLAEVLARYVNNYQGATPSERYRRVEQYSRAIRLVDNAKVHVREWAQAA
jgi:hypothetical protein